jgi:hypothetical protein
MSNSGIRALLLRREKAKRGAVPPKRGTDQVLYRSRRGGIYEEDAWFSSETVVGIFAALAFVWGAILYIIFRHMYAQ